MFHHQGVSLPAKITSENTFENVLLKSSDWFFKVTSNQNFFEGPFQRCFRGLFSPEEKPLDSVNQRERKICIFMKKTIMEKSCNIQTSPPTVGHCSDRWGWLASSGPSCRPGCWWGEKPSRRKQMQPPAWKGDCAAATIINFKIFILVNLIFQIKL